MDGTDVVNVETLDEPDPRREQALLLLLACPGDSPRDTRRRLRSFTECLASQSLCLGTVLGASVTGRLVSAAAVVESPGSLGTVYIPADNTSAERRQATIALLRALRPRAWHRSLSMLQTLVEGRDAGHTDLFTAAGFEFLAELIYLERSAYDPCPAHPAPEGLAFVPFTPEAETLFIEVMDLTYRQSLDCPELAGIRPPRQVLTTHRATGIHDPAWWLMPMLHGQPAGLLLLAGVRGRRAFEVVYMGVVPAFRGRGLGDAILAEAVRICRRHGQADLTLAVDGNNEPARRLYRRWSFAEITRRCAWFAPNPNRA